MRVLWVLFGTLRAFGVVSANGSDGTAINGEQALLKYQTEVTTFLLHNTKKFMQRILFPVLFGFLFFK